MSGTLRLGTRRSPMAIAQSMKVSKAITSATGREVEIVGIDSVGDASREQMTQIGGTGVFVSSLRTSLLAGEVDFAVHSLKDLPVGPAAEIVLAAVPSRDDPRDALVARDGAKLADLPVGATIGTGSPRRAAQLLVLRPDVRPVPLRGNAGTRLAKVQTGELDAVVLGHAGLARVGRLDAVTQVFDPDEMMPAPGQGALAVECRTDDAELVGLLAAIDHAATRSAVTAERSLLTALEAGCSAPVGAYATGQAGTGRLRLHAVVLGTRAKTPQPGALDAGAADGTIVIRESGEADAGDAARLGRELAARMLALGAADLMRADETDGDGAHD
jgi:hydroxymethylbilane synthase